MLKEGNKAPDFTAVDQNGNKVKLSAFKGKKNVVLYFYPRDMTPGCTTEACDFKDNLKKFKETVVLGVSLDSPERHQKFIDKYDLPFDLISDADQKVVNKFGVWQEKKLYGKTFMGIEVLEAAGLKFSGLSPDGLLPETVELVDHPWFIGVQFHPELKSKPFDPHPLFSSFVAAALDQSRLV